MHVVVHYHFIFDWFSRRASFYGGVGLLMTGRAIARQDVHAGLVCDLCESVLCVLLCDMPCAHVFGTSVFHFKGKRGMTRFTLQQSPFCAETRGSR